VTGEPVDRRPCGIVAPASREGITSGRFDLQVTRDCQSIAGFLLVQSPGRAAAEKGKNMNENYKRVAAQFGPETGFEVRLTPPAPFRAREEAELERLKAQLLAKRLEERREPRLDSPLRRAAGEAAALAWVTRYPLLVFPVLFQEKVEAALLRAERQEQVRRRSRELLAA
jgi:hypothetical protein